MKKNLLPAICFGSILLFSITGSKAGTLMGTFSHSQIQLDSSSFKLIDSVSAETGYTVFNFSDTTSLRMHFSLKTQGGAQYNSWSLPSDFVIAGGFISYLDAKRVAEVLINKLKAGDTQPRITKDDLAKNGIAQQ